MYFKPVYIFILLCVNNFKSIALFLPHSFDEPFYNTCLHPSRSSNSFIFFINQSFTELRYNFT
jgi:hypothetical protein